MISIQWRLIRSLLIGFGVLLGAGGAALYLGTRAMLLSDFDSGLMVKARSLASLVEIDHGRIELHVESELLPEFGPGREAFFQLYGADGGTLNKSKSLGSAVLPMSSDRPRTVTGFRNLILANGHPGRAVDLTFAPEDEEKHSDPLGKPLTIVAAQDRSGLDSYLYRLAFGVLATSSFMMVGSLLVASFAVKRGLAPVARLSRQVMEIDESSLRSRVDDKHLPRELAPICQRLNDLLERLDRAFTRERQFSDDVAHELRTPIAELRALADFSLSSAPNSQEQDAFRDARDIAAEMERIVNGLLAIARCEAGAVAVSREPLQLQPILQDLWQRSDRSARERAVAVEFATPPDICVSSDQALLRAILGNLISNAAEYATPNSTVHIRAAASNGNTVRISVGNRTSDLTNEDLPRVFDRFWRRDAARGPSTHSGLGLAIAQATARLLRTELKAEISQDGVYCVSLDLPAAEISEITRQ